LKASEICSVFQWVTEGSKSKTSMGMKAGSEVRFVVAHENGGIEVPWVGPATAQKFPFAAKRLLVNFISKAPYPW